MDTRNKKLMVSRGRPIDRGESLTRHAPKEHETMGRTIQRLLLPLKLALLIAVPGLLYPASAGATEMLDQSQTVSQSPVTVGYDLQRAQTFTAGVSGALDRVSLRLENYTSSPPTGAVLNISVQTVIGGLPSGEQIGTGTIPLSAIPAQGSGGDWVYVDISDAIVHAGSQYALVLQTSIWNAKVWWWDAYQNAYGSSYTRGEMAFNYGSGWSIDETNDFTFQTYVILQTASAPVAFGFSFGGYGFGMGKFYLPVGVAVGGGKIYVADTSNHKIQIFYSNGAFYWEFGTYGWGTGQFHSPSGVAVDAGGDIYVADTGNNRVQKFNAACIFLYRLFGDPTQTFIAPAGVAVDAGRIYVADSGDWNSSNNLIQVFDTTYVYLQFKIGGYGSGDGQFYLPYGVAVDRTGKIYVADTYNNRIQVFDASGKFLFKFGEQGINNGQFRAPSGVAVGSTGQIYVSDTQNDRIQVFDSTGNFLYKFGISGSGASQFSIPNGIAVDSTGKIYVADTGNYRIQVFYPVASSHQPYNFVSFFPPVNNPPMVNVAKAGSAVPVKFSLDGYYDMDILEAGYPGSQQIDCDSLDPVDIVVGTDTAGSKELFYTKTTEEYTYIWKTEKVWAGSCRQLILKLNDGTEHLAYFEFH